MARLIRFQTARGDCVTADELRDTYHRVQLARTLTLDAERRLRAIAARVLAGATVEDCELALDAALAMIFERTVAREERDA